MSVTGAKLAHALWHAHTQEEQLQAIREIAPNHTLRHINNTENNRGPANINSNGNNAIIECITNGLDAVIIDHINNDFYSCLPKSLPNSVDQALAMIDDASDYDHKAKVFVLAQDRCFNNKHRTITVIDEGCGIPEEPTGVKGVCMTSTVLSYGHMFKMMKNYQHGTFGQGGAASFGFSQGSFIASRVPNSDKYIFTYVWLTMIKVDEGSFLSYVYIKDGNFKFYSATEAELKKYGNVIFTDQKIKLDADDMVLPRHGTVRRMVGMHVETSPNHPHSLERALSDKMFGTRGWVHIVTDEAGAQPSTRTGRRHTLDSGVVGQPVDTMPSPVLLDKIDTVPMIVDGDARLKVHVKTWFLDDYKVNGKLTTPIRGYMSNDPKKTVASTIFVTLNGQTHDSFYNRKLLVEAGYTYLAENIVIEVMLDGIDIEKMHDAMGSNREVLKDEFRTALHAAVIEYCKKHAEFEKWNKYFADRFDGSVSDDQIAIEVNKFISNPIIGAVISKQSQSGNSSGDSEATKSSANAVAPFEANEYPTFIAVNDVEIKDGGTAWVVITTDAADNYGGNIKIILPYFTSAPATAPRLKNGRMVFQIVCNSGTEIGTTGDITVTLNDLVAVATVSVVSEKKRKPRGSKQTAPEVKFVDVNGVIDEAYMTAFPGISDDIEGVFNYTFDSTRKLFTIYINKKSTPWTKVEGTLSKYSKDTITKFDRFNKRDLVAHSMFLFGNTNFGSVGATEAVSYSTLRDVGSAIIATNGIKIEETLKTVERG